MRQGSWTAFIHAKEGVGVEDGNPILLPGHATCFLRIDELRNTRQQRHEPAGVTGHGAEGEPVGPFVTQAQTLVGAPNHVSEPSSTCNENA
jgi:hypothetical protein